MAISPTTSTAASTTPALSSSTSFNVDGIISGLKTADIIKALMTLNQAPLNQLTKQQAAVQKRDAAYQAISSQMIQFQSSVQNLMLSNAVNTKLASSVVPTVATATADSTAINGSFSVTVANLATATSATSSGVLGSPANLAPGTAIGAAGLAVAPTAGNFTLNGLSIAVLTTDTWATLQTKISTATGGAVTLNLGANSVSLTSATPVQLGSPTDTSNFLGATQLLTAAQTGAPGAYTVASNQFLGEAQAGNPLSTAGLNIAGGIAASGTFSVNGVAIAWANTDSLSGVLSRINSSSAGVTAAYDPKQDKVILTNTNTGAQNISLIETTGNFLQAANLTASVQVSGAAAQYTTTQNGVTSAAQFSNSNTVTGALQGVNLKLLSTGTTAVNVTQDTATATTNVQAFVTQFNSMVDLLTTSTAIDSTTGTVGALAGDSAIQNLTSTLYSLVSAPAVNPAGAAYNTMVDIGVSTGAYGSAVGTTNHLVLDTAKLTAALTNNSQAVAQVLSGLAGNTTMTPDPTNPWIASNTGNPFGQVSSGSYKVTFNPIGNTLTSVFTSTGGKISPATTGTIAPGGVNTTLISGISIVGMAVLPAASGTDTINYAVTSRGVLQSLNDYITQARGPGGIFVAEHTDATTSINNFSTQIADQNALLAQQQTTLQAQFTAMEVSLSLLQSQSASLSSSIASLTGNSSSSSSS